MDDMICIFKDAVRKWHRATYYGVGSQQEAAQAILDAVDILHEKHQIADWCSCRPAVVAIATETPATDGDRPGGDEDDVSFAVQAICEDLGIAYVEVVEHG